MNQASSVTPPKTSPNSIRAVLFDYGMVLSQSPRAMDWRCLQLALDPAGKSSAEEFSAAYWKYRDAYDRGILKGPAYWQKVANEFGITLDQPTLHALLEADLVAWTRPNTPMMDWAARLQRTGIKTGILSNMGDAMEEGIRKRLPDIDSFSHHTFSHRLHLAKPDPAIYLHSIQGLGEAPHHILFIDDRVENIDAARQIGTFAIQYSGQAAFAHDMQQMGLGWLLL
jgi:putative hydrolase of the HAD superfamily